MKINKLIMDFDGVFASSMLYDEEGKSHKIFPWGIRHSIDILKQWGFEVHIITGDSTEFGQNITKKFCENLDIDSITFIKSHGKFAELKARFNLDECAYVGDDIYDIEIFNNTYGITTADAHHMFNHAVSYKSKYTTRDYFFVDVAYHLVSKFVFNHELHSHEVMEYIVKRKHKTSMVDQFNDKRIKKVLFIQQYSMRNHSDNTYNPLLDGNLNLTLHRIYGALQLNPDIEFMLTIPSNCDEGQLELLRDFTKKYFDNRISLLFLEYGINAYENRKTVNVDGLDLSEFDLVVSDFENVGNNARRLISNFNISRTVNHERWFIDEFFDDQLNAALYARENEFVYVLNSNQKDYMIEKATSHMEMLRVFANVVVDKKVMNQELLINQLQFFSGLIEDSTRKKIYQDIISENNTRDFTFFMPFRLTDPCYNFKGIVEELGRNHDKTYTIIVTNPNEGKIDVDIPDNVKLFNIGAKYPNINKKTLYFTILNAIQNIHHKMHIFTRAKVGIPIYEDPEDILHQSLIEMSILAPDAVNFIDTQDTSIETLTQTNNNNYIQSLIYS